MIDEGVTIEIDITAAMIAAGRAEYADWDSRVEFQPPLDRVYLKMRALDPRFAQCSRPDKSDGGSAVVEILPEVEIEVTPGMIAAAWDELASTDADIVFPTAEMRDATIRAVFLRMLALAPRGCASVPAPQRLGRREARRLNEVYLAAARGLVGGSKMGEGASEIEITPPMVQAAAEVLWESGMLPYGSSTPSHLPVVQEMIEAALKAGAAQRTGP